MGMLSCRARLFEINVEIGGILLIDKAYLRGFLHAGRRRHLLSFRHYLVFDLQFSSEFLTLTPTFKRNIE